MLYTRREASSRTRSKTIKVTGFDSSDCDTVGNIIRLLQSFESRCRFTELGIAVVFIHLW